MRDANSYGYKGKTVTYVLTGNRWIQLPSENGKDSLLNKQLHTHFSKHIRHENSLFKWGLSKILACLKY
jgi:hypothetical protein